MTGATVVIVPYPSVEWVPLKLPPPITVCVKGRAFDDMKTIAVTVTMHRDGRVIATMSVMPPITFAALLKMSVADEAHATLECIIHDEPRLHPQHFQ
jgi:hypothetical protein